MASQHDPSQSAVGNDATSGDAQQRGGHQTSLFAALKADSRLRVRLFLPLFLALMPFTTLWNEMTSSHFAGFRAADGLRMLAVVLGLGASLTTLLRFFIKRST
jgi:hypothetical protein